MISSNPIGGSPQKSRNGAICIGLRGVSGQSGLFYCDLQSGNSQDQPAFSLFPRDRNGLKVRNSAALAKPAGCSFAAFNSEISERGSKLHIASVTYLK
jgi:hypothetical protein